MPETLERGAGATRAAAALRALMAAQATSDAGARRDAVMKWWLQWTATVGAYSVVEEQALLSVGRDNSRAVSDLLEHQRATRVLTIANRIAAEPQAYEENDVRSINTMQRLTWTTVSVLLATPPMGGSHAE